MLRFTGRPAVAYAGLTGAVLRKFAGPGGPARMIDVEEGREIVRADPSLVYVEVPEAVLEGHFQRVFGRRARIHAVHRGGEEATLTVEGWPRPVRVDCGLAWQELRRFDDAWGAGGGDGLVVRHLRWAGALREEGEPSTAPALG